MEKKDNHETYLSAIAPRDRYWIERMWQGVNPADIAPEPGRTPDPYVGKCTGCGKFCHQSDARQIEYAETCAYACRTCGHLIDEGVSPF